MSNAPSRSVCNVYRLAILEAELVLEKNERTRLEKMVKLLEDFTLSERIEHSQVMEKLENERNHIESMLIETEEKLAHHTMLKKGEEQNPAFLAIYPTFILISTLLTAFFAVSLILTFISQYFLDWGSALIGLLGSAGLALVGWFSKSQFRK
ncbi:hypothetical protein ACFLW6_01335 [Chloroflexota bacterium]